MYNRYIPRPDGTYQKNKFPDPEAANQHSSVQQQPQAETIPIIKASPQAQPCEENERVCRRKQPPKPEKIPGFIRQLLPKNLDTGDLMIILLLLLMAGDSEENKNNALLTLALYFLL